jgi:RNA polymerase sigma factor (sigma-70 family)
MRQIRNEDLAELLMQVRFAPPVKRQKQVDGAEQLLAIIEKDKEYPFEFVCFRITGFRPEAEAGRRLIRGEELAEDLRIFIWKLSGQVAAPASGQSEEVYTKEQLAKKLRVSTKTIDRWRSRGLRVRKYVFEDGRKRLGFLWSAVEKFLGQNRHLAEKAGRFTRLSEGQRQGIIERAVELSSQTEMSRRRIIARIASEAQKGQETIRCVLLAYEKAHPDKAGLIRKAGGLLGPAEAAEVDRLHKQKTGIKELMGRFGRSRSSIYRILKQRRAQALLARRIEFIQSNEFLKPDAEAKILSTEFEAEQPGQIGRKPTDIAGGGISSVLRGGSLSEYLEGLKGVPVLSRQQELELFRRYNYLKYHAAIIREQIKTSGIPSARLDEIERYLAEAEAVKRTIIEANLRLVVSIASRHTITGANLADLVSEGNVSLMQAVEKFDYTKGFRFSTYASWAISKDFAHRMPAQRARMDRQVPSPGEFEEEVKSAPTDVAAVERARNDLIQVIRNNLEAREQYIIINHFGLEGTLVKKNKKTLKQIGDDLGLSKERIRQIELIGLQKLRQSLSPEQFDLLRG